MRELVNRMPRGRYSVGGTGLSIATPLFGLLGVGAILVGLEAVKLGPEQDFSFEASWAIVTIGVVFVLIAFSTLRQALRRRSADARHRRLTDVHSREPWLADYDWPADRVLHHDAGIGFRRNFATFAVMAAILLPFHFLLLKQEGEALLWVVVALFDFAAAAFLVTAFYNAVQADRYGRTDLRLNAFPFHPGGEVDVTFVISRGISNFTQMSVALSCYEESMEWRGSGSNRSAHLSVFLRYRDEVRFEGDDASHDLEGGVPVRFTVPEGVPSTELHPDQPTYWEVEISAKTPGPDYHCALLVPVYARPAPGPGVAAA